MAASSDDITPISGLSEVAHQVVFISLIPVLGSILSVLIFAKFLPKLFLKIKNKFIWKFKDAYLDQPPAPFAKYIVIYRFIYIYLLTLGILAFIIPFVDPALFITPNNYKNYEMEGITPRCSMPNLFSLIGLILPIVIGLWSIGWAIQDSGLMHYRFDMRPGKMYEIEPVHVRYQSFLKGYAGISSILFLVQVVIFYYNVAQKAPGRLADMTFLIMTPIMIPLMALPAYIFYAKLISKKSFLRKGLPKIKILSEEIVLVKENEKNSK